MLRKSTLPICSAIVVALAGCSSNIRAADTAATPAVSGTPPQISVAIVTNGGGTSYWLDDARSGAFDARKSQNCDVAFVIPETLSTAAQESDVEHLLANGVQGIAISPVNEKAETPLLDDTARRIKLVTIDSDAPNSARLCYIGTDNHEAGLKAAELIKAALPKGGNIVLFAGGRGKNAKDRERGIRDGLAGSRIRIAAIIAGGQAVRDPLNVLSSRPDVNCLVGLFAFNGPAILRAVEMKHKVGKVKIVCWDSDPATMDGIRSGAIYGTIVQQPYKVAALSVQYLARAIQGDTSWIPAGKRIYVPVRLVTKANIDSYKMDGS